MAKKIKEEALDKVDPHTKTLVQEVEAAFDITALEREEKVAPAPVAPVSIVTVAPTAPLKTGPMLRGEKGARVLSLQRALHEHGYLQPRSMKADGGFDEIAGPELLVCAYNYAVERNFNLHNDEWNCIPEATITQALSAQPCYGRGIDVAKYQPVVDFAFAKQYGLNFAVIKATDIGHESQNSFTDASFNAHWKNALAADLPKTAYMFWHPALSPEKQANYYIAQTRAMFASGNCLRPVIDVERNDKLSSKEVNLRLQKVIEVLTAHFGKSPIIYTSRRVCLEQGITVGAECPVWLAYYVSRRDVDPGPKKDYQPTFRVGPPVPEQWKTWAIWQSGYAPHYPGLREGNEVDRNLLNVPLADLLL